VILMVCTIAAFYICGRGIGSAKSAARRKL
jgi:hypothetical protein